jgi:hypothetical protein
MKEQAEKKKDTKQKDDSNRKQGSQNVKQNPDSRALRDDFGNSDTKKK